MSSSENVKVVVRCRPLIEKERQSNSQTCVAINSKTSEIILHAPSSNLNRRDQQKIFNYDYVFDPDSAQELVYENSAFDLVESVLEGFNGTIFAYGQTSCGKTYTMMGDEHEQSRKGIIPRCFDHIISFIEASPEDKKFSVSCSFLEIYNEEIRDLLAKSNNAKTKCEIREAPQKGFYIKDLTQIVVHSVEELNNWKNIGNKNKIIGETSMNEKSSRSHTVFTVYIEAAHSLEGSVKPRITNSKLNMVDLAGSERQNKAQCSNERFKESVKINLSLSALGNVISALSEGKHSQHIPYRDSKLTKLLQDSLGGNTKTVMVATISPAETNYEETVGTLRYASRTKLIKNKPKINEDPKDALIRMYLEEIRKLKEILGDGDPEKVRQILQENKNLADELKAKEDNFKKLLEERENNEKNPNTVWIGQMGQNDLIIKGKSNENEKKKLEQLRKRVKKQKLMHDELMAEKEKHLEELNLFEHKFNNQQEEVIALRKANQELFEKYKEVCYDMEDLKREFEYEKENLLDTIRDQEKEIHYFEDLTEMVFTKEELLKIRMHTMWSEINERYKIPPFLFKDKELKFPNLTYGQGIDLLDYNKEGREMELNNNEEEQKNNNNDFEKDKEMFPIVKKGEKYKIKVKPVKLNTKQVPIKIIERKQPYVAPTFVLDDMTSPNLADRTRQKKEYLKTLDNMIEVYTSKYSKEKIIVPQDNSYMNAQSFTDFKELEKKLDIQMIKAKSNLNTLLEPISNQKNEKIIKELIDETPNIKLSGTIRRNNQLNRRNLPSTPKSVAIDSKKIKNNDIFFG